MGQSVWRSWGWGGGGGGVFRVGGVLKITMRTILTSMSSVGMISFGRGYISSFLSSLASSSLTKSTSLGEKEEDEDRKNMGEETNLTNKTTGMMIGTQ